MTAARGLELLRRIAEERHEPADLSALALRLRAYLSHAPAGYSLEDAFGLSVGPGGEPWYARERRAGRDRELCALVERFHRPDASVRERALWLQILVKRYGSGCWPRDSASGVMPEHYRGTEKEYLFRAFAFCPPPESDRQLSKILIGS